MLPTYPNGVPQTIEIAAYYAVSEAPANWATHAPRILRRRHDQRLPPAIGSPGISALAVGLADAPATALEIVDYAKLALRLAMMCVVPPLARGTSTVVPLNPTMDCPCGGV
jgi:hypothetical protein